MPLTIKTPNTTASSRKMRYMSDGPEKAKAIEQLIAIAQKDAPWTFGYFSDECSGISSMGL